MHAHPPNYSRPTDEDWHVQFANQSSVKRGAPTRGWHGLLPGALALLDLSENTCFIRASFHSPLFTYCLPSYAVGCSRTGNKYYSLVYVSTPSNVINSAGVGRVSVELMWDVKYVDITYLTLHPNFEYKHHFF